MTPIERTIAARGEPITLLPAGSGQQETRGIVDKRRESVAEDLSTRNQEVVTLLLAGSDAETLSVNDEVQIGDDTYQVREANGSSSTATEFTLYV